MNITNILMLLGGLGMFLFGMRYMGDGLELAAGAKMKKLLEALTKNRFLAVLVGMVVTAVIQSSCATTVMVVGFVNAGLMGLAQAAGIIMGAQVGTTITSVLIALDISAIAPVCIFIGVIMLLFSKKATPKHIGQIIIGFGILFQGIHSMSSAMAPLKDYEPFINFISNESNPLVGFLIGIVMCAVLQSSSAAIGVLQALAMQGLMPIPFAVFMIYGINIGSAIPPLISAFNAKTNAKRAAMIYMLFNIIGAVIFIPISLFTPYTSKFIPMLTQNPVVQISIAHIVFKLGTCIILFPFIGKLVDLSCKIVHERQHETELRFLYIDKNMMNLQSVTVLQIAKEVGRMAHLARENFVKAAKGFIDNDDSVVKDIEKREELINFLNHSITDYMIQVNALELEGSSSEFIGRLFHVVNDIERIGDHAVNLCDRIVQLKNFSDGFSDIAKEELKTIYEKDIQLFDSSLKAFENQELPDDLAEEIHQLEDSVDDLTARAQDNHIRRLQEKKCHTQEGLIFVKALNDFERIGDHSYNIAWSARKEKELIREI